jgi:hypothetical protein
VKRSRESLRVLYNHVVAQQKQNTKPKKPFDSSSKRKRIDEEGGDADDDVNVVHDIPDDGHDKGGVESDDKDGVGEGIGMKHPFLMKLR